MQGTAGGNSFGLAWQIKRGSDYFDRKEPNLTADLAGGIYFIHTEVSIYLSEPISVCWEYSKIAR